MKLKRFIGLGLTLVMSLSTITLGFAEEAAETEIIAAEAEEGEAAGFDEEIETEEETEENTEAVFEGSDEEKTEEISEETTQAPEESSESLEEETYEETRRSRK